MRTNVMLCDGDGCPAYLVPSGHVHPQPGGRHRDSDGLSDLVHAEEEAAAAGWVVAARTGDGRLDLCPGCLAAAELGARSAKGGGQHG